MNKIRPYTYFLLLAILSLSSCLKDDDGNVKINIDEEFEVFLYEELLPEQNRLMLHIQTIEKLECSNYDLGHSNTIDEETIIVSIDDLELEGDCDDIETIAQTNASLGTFEEGVYKMEINLNLNSITNKGRLTLANGVYSIEMETTHGININNDNLKTIPNGYVWGYVVLLDNSANTAREEFFNNLDSYTRVADLPNGHYGHFNILNAAVEIDPLLLGGETPSGAQSFCYKLDGDRMDLLNFVQAFQITQEDRVKVVLFTSEGDVL